jgi:hypothetical protein
VGVIRPLYCYHCLAAWQHTVFRVILALIWTAGRTPADCCLIASAALYLMQAGIDDAAKAAGLAAGHLESSAEVVAHKVGGACGGIRGAVIQRVWLGQAYGQEQRV